MKISVFVDDVGATAEDDEPFDEDRTSRILRVIAGGVLEAYEAWLTIEGADENAGQD